MRTLQNGQAIAIKLVKITINNEVLPMMTFNNVVEAIQNLSIDEKEEIQLLLKQYIREERRNEIYDRFKSAKIEQEKGELKFSSNIDRLRELIEE